MAGGKFSVAAIFVGVDRMSGVVAKIETRISRSFKNITKSADQINAITDRAAAGLKTFAIAGATAAAAGGLAFIELGKTGADFENAIAAVGAVSLMTRKEIEPLEKEARRLGSTIDGFGFTATQVAGAMELLGKAGFDNNEILQATPGLLAAAAAEGADLSEVAGLVSNTLKGMGMSTSETTRVADVLTLASARTNSSISSLGESMAIASSTAKQFKVPFEQVVASVALLQDVGLDASTAGTAVSTMLTKLAAPSKEARQEMAAMGIKFQDLHGDMLPLPEIFAQFAKAAQKSGGNMKSVAFFADLVGLRGEKAALNLKDLFTSGKFGELTKELEGAAGSAAKMAKLRMDTLGGDLKLLSNAADDVKISLFDMSSGPLRDVVKGITDWITKNKDLIVQDVAGFVKGVQDHAAKFADVAERLGRAAEPIMAVAIAMKAIALAQWAIDAAMEANPLTLWILGITAAAALIAYFWPEIKAFFSKVWGAAKDMASRVASAIGGFFSGIWSTIKGFVTGVAEFVVGLLVIAFEPLMPFLQPIFDALGAAADYIIGLWDPVSAFFSGLWDGVKATFSAFATFIVDAATTLYGKFLDVWRPVGEFFSGLWTGISETFTTIVGGLISRIESIIAFIRRVGAEALGLPPPPGGADQPTPIEGASDAVHRSLHESRSTTEHEITIQDRTGRAVVKSPKGSGVKLHLQPSGSFS